MQVLPVACPLCDQPTQRAHAYHRRQIAALPVAGRGVVVNALVRRLRCFDRTVPPRSSCRPSRCGGAARLGVRSRAALCCLRRAPLPS
ncbi:transposase family protein [Paractinoplanes rishiriensis]|uniref:transposase family protein n=1 Tax=Paractinoplanes rishiriensis TaxID=1050105 RepID=UPI0034DAD2D2